MDGVRLDWGATHGDEGVGVGARSLAEQEFELSHFVATGGDAIEVIALQPDVGSHCFREAGHAVERDRSQAKRQSGLSGQASASSEVLTAGLTGSLQARTASRR